MIGEKFPKRVLSLLQGSAFSGAEAGSHFAKLPENHPVLAVRCKDTMCPMRFIPFGTDRNELAWS